MVHVLCDPTMASSLRAVLRESTGSLGVRDTAGERWPAARSFDSVWIDGQLIRIKVSAGRVKAEHDDVALAARRTGQPLRELAQRAEALWRSARHGPGMTTTGEPTTGVTADRIGNHRGGSRRRGARRWRQRLSVSDRLATGRRPPATPPVVGHRRPHRSSATGDRRDRSSATGDPTGRQRTGDRTQPQATSC